MGKAPPATRHPALLQRRVCADPSCPPQTSSSPLSLVGLRLYLDPVPQGEATDGSLLHFFPFLKSLVHAFLKVGGLKWILFKNIFTVSQCLLGYLQPLCMFKADLEHTRHSWRVITKIVLPNSKTLCPVYSPHSPCELGRWHRGPNHTYLRLRTKPRM